MYYYAGSQRVAVRELTATTDKLYYLHGDHLGSTSLTTCGNTACGTLGSKVGELRYYPFGATRYEWGSTPTTYRFTGQRSEEAGLGSLYFYNARYYSSYLNRWIQPDTIVPDPSNPQALNRFSYSLSNPLKYTDPSGHCPAPPANMGPAICLALFIKPETVPVGGYELHGDGRDFSSNSDPEASRGYVWISVTDPTKWEAYMNQTGYIHVGPEVEDWCGCVSNPPMRKYISWQGPSGENKWTVEPRDNGDIAVIYDLVLAGDPLEHTAPHINGTIIFRPDSKGGYRALGSRDGFPWAEAYYHDGKGNIQTIFQSPAIEGDPINLYALEKYTSYPLHDAGKTFVDSDLLRGVFNLRQPRAIVFPE